MEALLEPGDVLPGRALQPLSGGGAVRVGPNVRHAQVVVLTHPEPCEACATYLTSLHEAADLIEGEGAHAVAVVTPPWRNRAASIPLPALIDDGVISSRLSRSHQPVVAVADRFGQLFARFDAGEDHLFPAHERILTSLLGIGIGCPECGVPDVPCATVLPDWDATSGGMRLLQ
ncbi:MAG: hypothetical protein M3N37_00750 [Actinomycetota bacterium]|nr:hypothetical protein [Actinomycetota bacterium]